MFRSVGFRTFLVCLLVLLVVGGGAVVAVFRLLDDEAAEDGVRAVLESAHSTYATLETERYKRLSLAAADLARAPEIVDLTAAAVDAAADEELPETRAAQTVLSGERAGHGEGMAAVLAPSGRSLVTTRGLPTPEALADAEAVRRARGGSTGPRSASGVWLADGRLHYLAVEPVIRDFEHLGFVATLFPVDEITAEEVRPPRGDVVFLAASSQGIEATSGTVRQAAADSIVEELRAAPAGREGLERALERGESIDGLTVEGTARDDRALLAPMRASSERASGAAVLFLAAAASQEVARLESLAILGVAAGLALLLAALLAPWAGRGLRRTAGGLEQAVSAGRRGDFEAMGERAEASGAFAGVASGLRSWASEREEERALREAVTDAASGDDGAAATLPDEPPGREDVALLALDLRGYARSTEAESSVEGFRRDLGRIRQTVRDRGGRIEAVSGHRILASFRAVDATDRALAALAAGAEIRRRLTRSASSFDEPDERDPPTLAVASGKVVFGTAAPGVERRLALGLPVQMLETLLREAAPGQILVSRDVHGALSGPLQDAGIEPVSQRGILTPQPLFELSPEAAGRVTGLDSPEGDLLTGLRFGDDATRPEPGEVLADRFEIRDVVGVGPLGTVYRAHDREFGRIVAFKAFRREALRHEDQLTGLDSSLGGLRSLVGSHVARTYDFGEAAHVPFLTRRWVPGLPLRRLVEGVGALSPAAAMAAGRQMAEALAVAHSGDVFHGRLKPENVIFEPGGSVVLTDFGCVFLSPPGLDLDHSSSGYLAPEQEHGEPGDARTDVYVWGLLVYDLVTGRIPSLGERVERKGEEGDVPEELGEILSRCLSPEPDRRYVDAAALLDALRELTE